MNESKLKDQLIRLNENWGQSSLDLTQFAKYHNMSECDMDSILGMIQSWDEDSSDVVSYFAAKD